MPLPHDFNLAGRREALTRLGQNRLDLLIVGGGITGCGIARDAALRGWTVGLVEKEDFAFGTSSRSSKIVHGGVRYLEYGHFLLVKEAAQERAVLRTIAPHLVHPLPFVFPVFGGESLLKIRAGLTVFDFLATSDGLEKHENLSPEEVREQLPGLRDPLKGAVRYPEYITDDARLTLENAQSAAEHGALVVNHARVQDFRMTDGRVAGCSVVDLIENRTVEVSTRLIVNATGAWSAGLLAEARYDAEFSLIPSKGSTSCSLPSDCRSRGRPSCARPTGREVSQCGAWVLFTSALPTINMKGRSTATRHTIRCGRGVGPGQQLFSRAESRLRRHSRYMGRRASSDS